MITYAKLERSERGRGERGHGVTAAPSPTHWKGVFVNVLTLIGAASTAY